MNVKKKNINGIITAFIIITVLVAAVPLNKILRNVVNDISDVDNNKKSLTASFEYLDSDNNPVHTGEKLYVFLSELENVQGDFIGFEISANNGNTTIDKIYNQNGDSNSSISNKKYYVTVATPKNGENNNFKENTKYNENDYDVYKNGDTYNGSYKIAFPDTIDFNGKEQANLKIEIKSMQGDKISLDEMLNPLELSTNFGVFALKYSQSADIEATIAVQKFEKNDSHTFGLSDRNFKALKELKSTGKITVEKIFTKNNDIPVQNKEITINLKSANGVVTTKKCETNESGKCSVYFENLENGTYSVSETIDGQTIDKDATITTNDGNIKVTFTNNDNIEIEGYSELQEILYNYNYVESIGTDKEKVNLQKMRTPGTLVVGSQDLVDSYKEHQDFKDKNVIVALAGSSTEYPTINFEEEFKKLEDLSIKLSKVIDSDNIKVYNLTSEEINKKGINFKTEDKEYILVNVDCTNVTDNKVTIGGENKRDGKDLQKFSTPPNGVDASFIYDEGVKIIYNFYTNNGEIKPFTGNIKIEAATSGTLLAPDAIVEGATGDHAGTIIAKEYNHTTGEVHQKVRPRWLSKETKTTVSVANDLTEEEHKEKEFKIAKVDVDRNPIAGAEVQLLDSDGKELEKWTTTNQPHIVQHELEEGKSYTIRELKAPEGYQLADDYKFTYNGEETKEYTMVDTRVIIKKLDETGTYLVGATLQIVDENGEVVEEWLSDGTEHLVTKNLQVGHKYYLREKEAPVGYKKADDIEFVYNPNSKDQVVEMKDQKIVIGVFIEKKNMNDELLSGAHLQVLDSNGTILDDWISDGTVHRVNRNLTIGETYTLHEEAAPEGYEVSPDVSFEVKNTEDNQIVTMVDNKIIIPGEPYVKIRKEDKDGKLLDGAELQLLDSEGNVLEEWTSNDKEHIVDTKLEVGKQYTLHEKTAPKGYEKAKDITFVAQENEQEVKMIDKRIKKVAGIVETYDNIAKTTAIFFISLALISLSISTYIKLNRKKLSK